MQLKLAILLLSLIVSSLNLSTAFRIKAGRSVSGRLKSPKFSLSGSDRPLKGYLSGSDRPLKDYLSGSGKRPDRPLKDYLSDSGKRPEASLFSSGGYSKSGPSESLKHPYSGSSKLYHNLNADIATKLKNRLPDLIGKAMYYEVKRKNKSKHGEKEVEHRAKVAKDNAKCAAWAIITTVEQKDCLSCEEVNTLESMNLTTIPTTKQVETLVKLLKSVRNSTKCQFCVISSCAKK